MTTTAQKACLIVVSCNPTDYMKIVVASKPFVKMIGVKEDLLLDCVKLAENKLSL